MLGTLACGSFLTMNRLTSTNLSFSENCQWTSSRPEAMPPCGINGNVPTRYELLTFPDEQLYLMKRTVTLVATARMWCSPGSAGSILNILWAPRDGVSAYHVWWHGTPAQRAAASRQVLCRPQGKAAGLIIYCLSYSSFFAGCI